jgi:hypothetical protein
MLHYRRKGADGVLAIDFSVEGTEEEREATQLLPTELLARDLPVDQAGSWRSGGDGH